MNQLEARFKVDLKGLVAPNAMVIRDCVRFTLLTSELVRIEYAADGIFEDRCTQTVIDRQFDVPEYRVVEDEKTLEIITEAIHLYYQKGILEANTLYIDVKGNFSAYSSRWYYGQPSDNLKGTYRTLDMTNGPVELEDGILSKNGFSVIDDSTSLLLTEDGWIAPREKDVVDLYFFGYGREYKKALKDFFKLTGPTPLLPRYTLGNWWSRYWEYNEKSLGELIDKFSYEDIPFSVCVMDMDWHLTNIDNKYGSGWTGYTWNKELFRDPKEFLRELHQKNLRVTLNLHPADGVKGHEKMYEPMAKELGIDYEHEDPINFNITDKNFLNAYFKYLHHPLEDEGVDFWWIDWQQGGHTRVKGLDPLWMLNHYHFHDMKRTEKRPLIFSRYAGVGSHRYPIGFSGDTYITWEAYRFQPYFTANASNIGYCWWSHDIGGHFNGYKDDELCARWVQFGTFSPIMRLHSSKSMFTGKEPWNYNMEVEKTIKEHLRLRHQLVPYSYTMNWKLHDEGQPFIQPMYYEYPNHEEAYQVPNQYFFGSELIVAPITEKINPVTRLAKTKAWLPEGEWFDFFDGTFYQGNRNLKMFRGIERQVVLAKAGAIVPLAKHHPHQNTILNPTDLEVLVFPGNNGQFELYEDAGDTTAFEKGEYATTLMKLDCTKGIDFTIEPAKGCRNVVPQKRYLSVMIRGVKRIDVSNIEVYANENKKEFQSNYDETNKTLKITIEEHQSAQSLHILIKTIENIDYNEDKLEKMLDILNQMQIDYEIKDAIYKIIQGRNQLNIISDLRVLNLQEDLYDALLEIAL